MKLFKTCLILFCLMLTDLSVAQFNFSEGPVVSLELSQPYEIMDIYCTPDSARDITMNWELLEMESSLPSEWDFTICDFICYPFFPSTGAGITYVASDWDTVVYNLKLGVSHNNVNGSGSLIYYLFDVNDPTYGDTIVFHLNLQDADIEGVAPLEELLGISYESNGLVLAPQKFPLDVSIRTMAGALVFEKRLNEKEVIRELPPGMYFLLVDNDRVQRIVIGTNQNK